MVEFFNPITNSNISYHIDKRMQRFLDRKIIPNLATKDKDYVLLCDGYEGVGKSTFAQQIGKYVDPTLDLSRICMTADEFKMAIATAKHGQCVIYDEAVTGLTAGDSISRIGKLLKSMMMQMRQKNLFVIVILPIIFELNKYAVLSRARCLFHIYENKGVRGYFAGYNKKDMRMLYIKGKKYHSYCIRTRFKGRFYGKYVVDEAEYRKKKGDALFLIDDEDKKEEKNDRFDLIGSILNSFKKEYDLSMVDIENIFKKHGTPLKRAMIARYCHDTTWKDGKSPLIYPT